jgi:hypothetical protein
MLRAARRALEDGVNSVNLTAPRSVYEELFSFVGTGTLFTRAAYGSVKSVALEDFEEAEAMIKRGQNEGLLLARSDEEIARILPSCFGYRIGDDVPHAQLVVSSRAAAAKRAALAREVRGAVVARLRNADTTASAFTGDGPQPDDAAD